MKPILTVRNPVAQLFLYVGELLKKNKGIYVNPISRLFGVVSFVRSDFNTCLKTGQVVSDVFCLPSNYRKDVPPKSKKSFKHKSVPSDGHVLIAAHGPLNVLFKLPITEISEVNDHKSVIIFSIITPL